jgi:hypothetical protein
MTFFEIRIKKFATIKTQFKRNWRGVKTKKRSFLTSFLNWLPLSTIVAIGILFFGIDEKR